LSYHADALIGYILSKAPQESKFLGYESTVSREASFFLGNAEYQEASFIMGKFPERHDNPGKVVGNDTLLPVSNKN